MNREDRTRIRRYGTPMPEPEPEPLSIGRMRLFWHAGAVRRLTFDGIEIVRGLSMVVRDANWGTHRLTPIVADSIDEPLVIRLRHHAYLDDPGDRLLDAMLDITISETRLDACLRLTAERSFETARSGLVVLLPLDPVVGQTATVTHDDGRQESAVFPEHISPSQPFFSIRRLGFAPTAELAMTLAFEGDVFEMEDQRNWSDASFKIYNRPLAWPTPYRLEAGESVEQRVVVTIDPSGPEGRDA